MLKFERQHSYCKLRTVARFVLLGISIGYASIKPSCLASSPDYASSQCTQVAIMRIATGKPIDWSQVTFDFRAITTATDGRLHFAFRDWISCFHSRYDFYP